MVSKSSHFKGTLKQKSIARPFLKFLTGSFNFWIWLVMTKRQRKVIFSIEFTDYWWQLSHSTTRAVWVLLHSNNREQRSQHQDIYYYQFVPSVASLLDQVQLATALQCWSVLALSVAFPQLLDACHLSYWPLHWFGMAFELFSMSAFC